MTAGIIKMPLLLAHNLDSHAMVNVHACTSLPKHLLLHTCIILLKRCIDNIEVPLT